MFSAEAPSTRGTRSTKRTRQTIATTDESIKLPATKKRRSAIRRDTFEPLTQSSLNQLAAQNHHPDQPAEQQNGSAVAPGDVPSRSTSRTRELTFRGGKKLEKRSDKGAGLLTLSTNDFYTVAQLPALPEAIRTRPTVPYSCAISPENDYVLALTHKDALLWSYNATASTPSSRELISFKLPFPPASADDPLPLAAFTAKSTNDEPGIVIISPRWGKIVYYETLTNATSYITGQSSNGVQGSVPGMLSGETIKELVPAEPAGFILSLSHGRVAQLTVRDQMGRPAIGVQFMRKTNVGSVGAGIFGSIRNAFGGDRRRGTPLVQAGKSARSQRDIIVCTEDAELEFWTNNLVTGNALTKSTALKETILSSLEQHIARAGVPQPLQFKVVDINLNTTPINDHALTRKDDAAAIPISLLIAVSNNSESLYYLVEAVVTQSDTSINVVHAIRSYRDNIKESSTWRPRICIPTASTSAFILFEKAIVVMSLARVTESPSSQLLGEKAALPEPFQDCIRFHNDTVYRLLSYAVESEEISPTCILAVQGFGMVRVTSHLPKDEELDLEDIESTVGPKSKIEQAIFFGNKKSNPLNLRRISQDNFDPVDVRKATMSISSEIISSKSKFLPKSSSAISDHLSQRARALQDLIEYVLKAFPNVLSRVDRFLLLFNAEKLSAAQAIWKVQEQIQRTYPRKDERDMTYLNFVLRALHESRQKYPDRERGEIDHVRHWLIHSVAQIDRLLSELEASLLELPNMEVNDPNIVCDYLGEAVDLWTAAYKTVFKFREDNAKIYGLGNEVYQNGVLAQGYPPEVGLVWTSEEEPVRFSRDLVTDVCQFLDEWWSFDSKSQANGSANKKGKGSKEMPLNLEGKPYDIPKKEALLDLADRLPLQVELYGRIIEEANIQHQEKVKTDDQLSEEQKAHALAHIKPEAHESLRRAIGWIAPFNRDGSIQLAEDTEDTELLVDLNLAYLAELAHDRQAHPEDADGIVRKIHAVQEHAESYFERFGKDWAYSHFSSLIMRDSAGVLLIEAQAEPARKQKYLTDFLEKSSHQRLGKVKWINDIVGENKFYTAGAVLENVAESEETDLWCKRTEICLAKLAGLAAQEQLTAEALPQEKFRIEKFDQELLLLRIAGGLGQHIRSFLGDSLDEEAAINNANELFIPKSISTNKKLQQTRKHLSTTLAKLYNNEVINVHELVDALTLLQLGEMTDDFLENEQLQMDVEEITNREYPLCLKAVDLASPDVVKEPERENLRVTVWRRLCIADDWSKLNNTAGKSDDDVKHSMQDTTLFRSLLAILLDAHDINMEVRIPSFEDMASVKPEENSSKEDDLSKNEVKTLKHYIEKARLKEHFEGLLGEARDAVREYKDVQGEQQAQEVATNGDSHA